MGRCSNDSTDCRDEWEETSAMDQHDPFPILGFDHVELHVGNATQAAHFYRALGFAPVAYRGLETGSRDEVSWCLRQGEVTFVLTGGLGPESPVAGHVALHGDGVHDVAFTVPDAEEAYRTALARGATGVREPEVLEDEHGKIVDWEGVRLASDDRTDRTRRRWLEREASRLLALEMAVASYPHAGMLWGCHMWWPQSDSADDLSRAEDYEVAATLDAKPAKGLDVMVSLSDDIFYSKSYWYKINSTQESLDNDVSSLETVQPWQEYFINGNPAITGASNTGGYDNVNLFLIQNSNNFTSASTTTPAMSLWTLHDPTLPRSDPRPLGRYLS